MPKLISSQYHKSLGESYASVKMYQGKKGFKKYLSFWGVGLMVAVGYMDPGNWATDIAGGSLFGYQLLFVVLAASLMAMLLQYLAIKLGVATDKDLAQACRAYLPRKVNFVFWILCEIAIIACDLAELLGSAIALNLLFDMPILVGVVITLVDVFLILYLQGKGFRYLETLIGGLVGIIFLCFLYEIIITQLELGHLLSGFVPTKIIFTNSEMLFIAIGILGATVMPHNLYLHSSVVQTRNYERNERGKKEAIKYASIDSFISLFLAFFINAAILILSASVFHGGEAVEEIQEAYYLLSPALGDKWASIVFALALLCAGQSSTITGTLAGQIVMEGFLNIQLPRWSRRLITRSLAIIPAFLVIAIQGESEITFLLILSQVILSMQLSFAVVPLIYYTSHKTIMSIHRNTVVIRYLSWFVGGLICLLNLYLLTDFFLSMVSF